MSSSFRDLAAGVTAAVSHQVSPLFSTQPGAGATYAATTDTFNEISVWLRALEGEKLDTLVSVAGGLSGLQFLTTHSPRTVRLVDFYAQEPLLAPMHGDGPASWRS